ncbi:putative nuclear distribution protein C [Cardiosporidium cionae]|uniref:Nuclear distribution protein C n=1 Tax=Cardiosporidium cionae TaxID=476202 RepID=A0ABQ7J7D0_9APIC|nr:putative nuclear distribution protein C [Cardiosporidium cionae]|eukprot:KAF8819897.1 putative nuclear distribution protein C [Cardiosporidium cionae]
MSMKAIKIPLGASYAFSPSLTNSYRSSSKKICNLISSSRYNYQEFLGKMHPASSNGHLKAIPNQFSSSDREPGGAKFPLSFDPSDVSQLQRHILAGEFGEELAQLYKQIEVEYAACWNSSNVSSSGLPPLNFSDVDSILTSRDPYIEDFTKSVFTLPPSSGGLHSRLSTGNTSTLPEEDSLITFPLQEGLVDPLGEETPTKEDSLKSMISRYYEQRGFKKLPPQTALLLTNETFFWRESIDTIQLRIPLESDCKLSDIQFHCHLHSLSLSMKNKRTNTWTLLLNGKLKNFVQCDEAFWAFEEGKGGKLYLNALIPKRRKNACIWYSLFKEE